MLFYFIPVVFRFLLQIWQFFYHALIYLFCLFPAEFDERLWVSGRREPFTERELRSTSQDGIELGLHKLDLLLRMLLDLEPNSWHGHKFL